MKELDKLTDEQRTAMEQIHWWFNEREAEMQRRHDQRMRELRRSQKISFVVLGIVFVTLLAQIAMRIWWSESQ